MKLLPPLLLAAVLLSGAGPAHRPAAEAVQAVMAAETALRDVPLREVIAAATAKQLLDLQPGKIPADAAARDHISAAADQLLTFLNAADSPVPGLRRINEASRHAEDKLAALLNSGAFTCGFPKTAAGGSQRSGYPDLRLVHKDTGRVYYLDPKLYEASSEQSTLRTFYYEPKDLTGKITDDACHLILGISHDGKDGAWRFTGWRLINLYDFPVRLKAEFQASNRDLYREDRTVARSPK